MICMPILHRPISRAAPSLKAASAEILHLEGFEEEQQEAWL